MTISSHLALVTAVAMGLLSIGAGASIATEAVVGAGVPDARTGIGTRGYTYADLIEAAETEIDFSQIEITTRVIVVGTADLADAGGITAQTYLDGDFERPPYLLARAGANEQITLAIELQGFSYAEHDISGLMWGEDGTLVVFVNTLD